MRFFADSLIETWPFLQGWPPWLVYGLVMLVFGAMVLFGFVSLFAGIVTVVERRIAARMHFRIGPNRVGFQGCLQWLADGIKNFTKEDLIPGGASKMLYLFAPYLVFTGLFLAFVTLPFGQALVISDLNVGIFYILAVTSFVTVGLVLAGWASNNKWSLLGGIRSAAQIVSYEIPTGLAVLTVVLMSGTLSTQGIIGSQGVWPWDWFVFANPFVFITFFIFFISTLAEGNRVPFDLPEAESELVAGYNVEYSGMRFVFFFFAEYANLFVMGALTAILFFGGWNSPVSWNIDLFGLFPAPLEISGTLILMAKALSFVVLIIWLRWTLPRLRVDQLMVVCWQYLVPIAFVCMLGTAFWMIGEHRWADLDYVKYPIFLFGVFLVLAMAARTVRNIRRVGDPVDLNPFQ
jgi:NADH-quinone oxidoreductase subunit H